MYAIQLVVEIIIESKLHLILLIMRILTRYFSRKFSSSLRSPINIDLLKTEEGLKGLKASIQARFKSEKLLDNLHNNYQTFRKNLYELQNLNKQANDLKKHLKSIVKTNQTEQIDKLKQQLTTIKETQNLKQQQLKDSKLITQQLLLTVGNSVHKSTVISKDQNQNRILRYFNPKWQVPVLETNDRTDHKQIEKRHFAVPTLNKNPSKISYQDLNNIFKISDLTRGQKVSGHRGYFLCTNGVKLALGIAQYGLEFLQNKGYDLYETPALILEEVLKDSCQLNTINTDMYRFTQDGLCLIATSEQTLAGYHRGETLELKKLPIRMGGYSSCFRREAGAHGKDIHGLFRLHQFQKVEQFVICQPSQSENQMDRMLQTSEEFYQSLSIPYRVVDIVSGELNDPAIRKIDLEAWFPSQGKFRELVSISNCTDYQSRLLQTRFRQGTVTNYPHMLNGTLVAVQRAITCFLEHFYNNQAEELEIPAPLQPFVRAKSLKKAK